LSRRHRLLAISLLVCGAASAAPNPVLPRTADCGVLRFGGEYYLMGVGTNGGVYVSRDLAQWQGPFHVFSMQNAWAQGVSGADQKIHACDLSLLNGKCHLYWSVNHGELRQIGHAVADDPLGPYTEPVTNVPFDGRIDPQAFVDDTGALYFYTVKFTNGNVIWGQKMHDPWTLTGEPVPLLSTLPGTWEQRDTRVNEAPFAFHYRGRYYLLYNANHTGSRYGNYAVGVAEGDAPLNFSNATKYPFPVLDTNRERLLTGPHVLSPLSLQENAGWRYQTVQPEGDWTSAGFDDSGWSQGAGAFGNTASGIPGGKVRTTWESEETWLRRAFYVAETPSPYLQLVLNCGCPVEVYLNDAHIWTEDGARRGYAALDLTPEARDAMRVGTNVLAMHCRRQGAAGAFVDAGLLDLRKRPGEPVISNCGQPTLVRGPNGFERWLVYFAIYNGDGVRSQAIDRVHFFDRELFVEGPTCPRTPGYHPLPAMPTFHDFFDTGEALSDAWIVENGEWRVIGGHATHEPGTGPGVARCAGAGGRFYLFETVFRIPEDGGYQAGVATGDVFIGLDREDKSWFAQPRFRYDPKESRWKLASYFDWSGWHTMRIECNGYSYRVWLDEISLKAVPAAGYITDVRPALFARGRAVFDNVSYTLGWDGAEDPIFDWAAAACGTPATGDWTSCERGIRVVPGDGEARVYKGDLLDCFEWAVQVIPETTASENGAAPEVGVYAAYADEANHLRITANPQFTALHISGVKNGKSFSREPVPVPERVFRYRAPEENGHNLRIVKLSKCVLIFVDGQETASEPGSWPPAQVGLFATGAPCRFAGISLYDRSRAAEDSPRE